MACLGLHAVLRSIPSEHQVNWWPKQGSSKTPLGLEPLLASHGEREREGVSEAGDVFKTSDVSCL